MTTYFKRYDKQGEIIDEEEYMRLRLDPDYRKVGSDVLPDGTWVSTVWYGSNLRDLLPGGPYIFETAVFKSQKGGYELDGPYIYATLAEAEAGHREMVEKWRNQ